MTLRERLRSRTYWLCWGILGLASVLTYTGRLDGPGWVTVALGTLTAWQLRRYGDNKLQADGVTGLADAVNQVGFAVETEEDDP